MSSGSRPPWVGPEDPSVNDQLRQEYAARGQSTTTLRLAADSVEAYLEYERVVGGQDGGELLTDEQYALFRQTALERSANRLYVTWRNSDGTGLDCKAVGPATLCECGHRYKEHTRLADQARELRCRAPGCACASYQYLPSAGAWHAKCGCKHGAAQHDAATKTCTRCACGRFHATFSCGCGQLWAQHRTVVETRQQRMAAGRPVDNLGGGGAGAGYAALGGITDFSSLTDGYEAVQRGTLLSIPGGEEPVASAPAADALSRLKSSRATARAAAAVDAAATPGGAAGGASHASADGAAAMTYKEKRLLAAQAASEAAAARRAAAEAREAVEIAKLPELEQLYRLSLKQR